MKGRITSKHTVGIASITISPESIERLQTQILDATQKRLLNGEGLNTTSISSTTTIVTTKALSHERTKSIQRKARNVGLDAKTIELTKALEYKLNPKFLYKHTSVSSADLYSLK